MDAALEGPPPMSFVRCDSTDERGRPTRVAALQVVGGFRQRCGSPAVNLLSHASLDQGESEIKFGPLQSLRDT
ncbi:hypothetical protein TTRE_0000852501 [Trichuris trichiura]|uniref:Uncharacterized protein n=1 Tax=Trichuris trichiura TaxID=36087 RepID=A0A077ZIG7_TRITR|nr:hypothetical protein TTRE_0000852501 [Trichuris trichiura]